MREIEDLTYTELDYVTMKLDGEDFMCSGQTKSYFEYARSERLVEELREALPLEIIGWKYGWGVRLRLADREVLMRDPKLLPALLRTWCVWKNGGLNVPDDFFEELRG